jgi:hypothetical protein
MFLCAKHSSKDYDYMLRAIVSACFLFCLLFSNIGCSAHLRARSADPIELVFDEEQVNQQIGQFLMNIKNELALYSDGIPDTLRPRIEALFASKFDSADFRHGLYAYMRDAYGTDLAKRHLEELDDPAVTKMRKHQNDSLTKEISEKAQSCLQTVESNSDSVLTAEYSAIDQSYLFDSIPNVYAAISEIVYGAVAWSLRSPFQVTPEQLASRQEKQGQQLRYFLKVDPCIEISRHPSEPPEFFFKYGRLLRTKSNEDFEFLKIKYLIRRLKEAGADIQSRLKGKAVAG